MLSPKLILIAALTLTASTAAPKSPNTARQLPTLPLHFEPNLGQFDPQVRFIARGAKYQAWITDTELVLAFPTNQVSRPPDPRHRPEPRPLQREIVRLKFGAQKPSSAAGVDKLAGVSNYFLGSDPSKWRPNVPNFAKVRLNDVYPGIDAVFYGKGQEIEYDFIVKPGADPAIISMRIDGPQSPRISSRGDLSIALAGGRFTHRAPIAFQGEKPLIADARLNNGRLGFHLGTYDRSRPVTIDPLLEYSTYLGGGANSEYMWQGIAVDSSGNAIVGGYTLASDFPTTPGSFDTVFNNEEGFIAKLNATGTGFVFSTFVGGTAYDRIQGIALDSLGQVYVTGYTGSGDYPTTPGAYDSTSSGIDAFVTKLAANGASLIYSTFIGGGSSEDARSIAVDGSGNAYITGTVAGGYPTTSGSVDPTANGLEDVFVTKFNPTGTALLYSTYLGGTGYDWGYGIAVDAAGVAYVAGVTQSANFPSTPGAFDTTINRSNDAFVAAINPSGSALNYATFVGGTNDDYGFGIGVDSLGNTYLAGTTYGGTFPLTPGAYDSTYNGSGDAFVAKLNPSGNALVYSTFFGGPSIEWCYRVAIDTTGAAVIAGYTYTPIAGFPTTPGAFDTTANGANDAFVAKLSPSGGSLAYSTYLGGSSDDYGVAVALDAAGSAYLVGQTLSSNLPVTAGAFDTTYGGSGAYDAFVSKISFGPVDSTPPVITVNATPGPNANGWNNGPVTVTFTVTDPDSAITSQSGCGTTTLSTETAGTTLTCTAASAGGSASQSVTVRIDLTMPGFGTAKSPAPNANGWNNTNVNAIITCSDALSGPVNLGATITVTTEGFNQTVYHTCQDLAGNALPIGIGNINIDKTAPVVASVSPSPNPAAVGTPVTLAASLTDAGSSGLEKADYKVDTAAYALLATASGAAATVSNGIGSFPSPALPEVCVRATDLAGNVSAEECRLIAVFDPNGGFVTGGGTIQSPAGALTAQPAASGRANFAFESRYQPGANVPTGKTLFKFKTANFEFDSTVYEWLVVAGARAQYKGEGVIKGVSGTYQFILTAIDGQQPGGGGGQDKLRLKITGPSGVVYDNQIGGADNDDPTTAIDGGSIVIHKP